MANPPGLQYCKIYGNFKAFVADGGADGDDLPDFVPMTGYGEIYPNVEIARNTNMGFKSTYFNSPVSVTVDTDGDLSQGGRKYIMVLASSPDINPTGFNYTIRLTLTAVGETKERSYGPFAFDVIPGGEVDLTDVFPISASGGTPIIQGPQGETGPVGPMGPVGAGIPAGGTALQLVRKKADNSTTEWVSPDKTLVGLNNVDNTSDANKPVSTAQQTALNAKEPTIAAGTTAQYWRGDKSWQTLNKAAVGLSNVDNTSDASKPVSTAQQTALNAKEPTVAAGTTAQFYRGDKTWVTPDKNSVGLGNVDNTSDVNKPVSTATQNALNLKLDASKASYWQPNTAYALGQVVLSPGGNLIKSKVAHTSGTSYSGIGTNWADVEQGQSVVLNTNYMTNPAAYSVATGFGTYVAGTSETGTQTFVTGANDGPIPEITSYGRWSCTAPKTAGSTGWTGTASSYRAMVSGVSGNSYTTSLWMRYTGTGTVTTTLRMVYYDTNGTSVNTVDSSPVALVSGVWTKLTVTGPATGAFASIGWWAYQTSGATVPAGTTLDATGIVVSSVGNTYFSGATASNPDYLYAWTGTANASTSTLSLTSTGYVPKWAPNTAYTAGQQVIAPTNDVVSAKTSHTSGATYSATNWDASSAAPRGLLALSENTSSGGASTGTQVILTIPSFTFLANRWYEVQWTASIQNATGASGSPLAQIQVASTADAAAATTGLTEIMGYNVITTGANQTIRMHASRRIRYATNTTYQIKATLNGVGQSCNVVAGPTFPAQLSIADLGMQF